MIRTAFRRLVGAVAVVFALLCAALPAMAGQVSNLADSGSGSLRAVVAAGGNVTFASGLSGTIQLTSGPITVPPGTTISGPGADRLKVDGGNGSRIFDIGSDASGAAFVTIHSLTLTRGNAGAGGRGGAIRNAGVLNLGALEITNSTAGDAGGAIYNSGTLSIWGSLLTGNNVTDATCAGGGAIRSEGSGSALSIRDSTITQNTANACNGGGVSFNDNANPVELVASTIVGNSAGLGGGNVYKGSAAAALTLNASVIADGIAGGGTPVNPDLHASSFVSLGRNLVRTRGDATGYTPSDLPDGTNPMLDALAIHGPQGGPTRTIGFAWNSPLRDAVTAPCAIDVDQRNVARPQGSACDIGAFEYRVNRLSVSVSGLGTVSASSTQTPRAGAITNCSASCSADYDGETGSLFTVRLAATPGPDQTFAGWGGDCAGAGTAPIDVPMDASHACTATFVSSQVTVTPSVSGGNGTISPATPQTVSFGQTASFTLTPATNYHVANVTGTCGGSLAGNVYTTNAVTTDCTVIASFAIDTHTVTPGVAGGNGTISPPTAQTVDHGATTSFTLTPSANYHVASVTGTCGGSLAGNVYTTNAVTTDCTVIASFAIDTHTVTPSVSGGNGAISPATPQVVNHGASTSFTLTPNANYHVASVTGTCGGSLAGNVYTTNAVAADCTVIASFAIDTHTVTPSVAGGNGTIAPATAQSVNHGATASFTLTPNANYHVASVTGTCGGTLAGNVYTTNAVTTDCTVIASFAIDTHTVTPSVTGGNGTISPDTPQTVNHGSTLRFTLTPAANHHVASVTGTCGGILVGTSYTTNAVNADCTVIASFAIDTHTVTPGVSGGNGSISPSTPQAVTHGETATFTLAPAANYHVASVGGSCGGSLVGNTFTTNAVVSDCTVVANFALDTHAVTPDATGGGSISPSTVQQVDHGATAVFTLTPAVNHHIDGVTGTCGGMLAGNVYTTNAVTADCTVVANFAIDTHTVSPGVAGGNGTISPATAQTVDHGATTTFTLTPAANHHVAGVTGTCGGSLAGNVYTTSAIVADCTVIASFAIDTHTVTPGTSGNGTISPSAPQLVDHGATTTFTLAPAANHHVVDVGGTCGGSLAGTTYTTDAIVADCIVVANFAVDTFTVTANAGPHGSITPATQAVEHGTIATLSVTPDAHYHIASVSGCAGGLSGTTYTTGPVDADCTVTASFAIDTHTVGGTVDGLLGAGLVLQLNGAFDLPITADGRFVFAQALDDLGTYAVTIRQQPSAPTQVCSVANGSGTLDGSDVTNVQVTCQPPLPHLAITVSDARDYARYGMLLNYVVTVTNDGEGDAHGVVVANTDPAPQLDAPYTRWSCFGAGAGATCTFSGEGALNDANVSIPAGRSLSWLVSAPVRLDAPGGMIDYTVATGGASATDTDALVILRTGFDVPYGDGAEGDAPAPTVACLAPAMSTPAAGWASSGIDVAATRVFMLPATPGTQLVDTVLAARSASGSRFRVERLNLAAEPRVRLVVVAADGSERAGAWALASRGAQLAIGLVAADDGSQTVLLEGATPSLQMMLPLKATAPLLVGACE